MDPDPKPIPPLRRETTAEMVRHISRELAVIESGLAECQASGDRQAEARLTGCWMAHLLVSSAELLHNLLIDTAVRPSPYRR